MTHREGLARKSTVLDNRREKLGLLHIRQDKADGVVLARELLDNVCAVNVVHLAAILGDIAEMGAECEYKMCADLLNGISDKFTDLLCKCITYKRMGQIAAFAAKYG